LSVIAAKENIGNRRTATKPERNSFSFIGETEHTAMAKREQ